MYIFYGLSATKIVEDILGDDYEDEVDDYEFDDDDCCRIEELDDDELGYYMEDEKVKEEPKPRPVQALVPIAVAAIPQNVCSICYEEFDESEMQGDVLIGAANPTKISVRGCKHPFCKECMLHYVKVKLGNAFSLYHAVVMVNKDKYGWLQVQVAKTYGIPCPAHKCEHVMLLEELTTIISEDLIDQFHRFSKIHEDNMRQLLQMHEQKKQEEEAKKLSCPKCASSNVRKGSRKNRMKCLKCHAPFCSQCGQAHRPSLTCDQWAKLGKRDLDGETLKKFGLIRCPNCFTPTQKIDGCNYVTCRCNQPFCWLCGCALDNTQHFNHFVDNAPFGNACKGPSDRCKKMVGLGAIRI